eukprot:3150430-Ditylum_brightwellii.AAC.1
MLPPLSPPPQSAPFPELLVNFCLPCSDSSHGNNDNDIMVFVWYLMIFVEAIRWRVGCGNRDSDGGCEYYEDNLGVEDVEQEMKF